MTFNRSPFNRTAFNRGAAAAGKADAIILSLSETSRITVYASSSDDLLITATDTKRRCGRLLTTNDRLMIAPGVEGTPAISVSFKRGDSLLLSLAETNELINIHTLCNAPVRTIHGKVEITYSDPYRDETMTITASGTAFGSDVNDTSDNLEGCTKDWFEVGVSKLDGVSYAVPGDEGSVGWWSDVISDASGNISPAAVLTVVLIEPTTVPNLKVIGDDVKGEYPVDFVITLYDATDTLLHTETVTGNASWEWRKTLSSAIEGVTKLVLTITKINTPLTNAKITEFYTAYYETYYDDDLFGINLLEEMDYESGTLPIGNISANEIAVRLNNYNRKFTPGNPNSSVAPLMLKNRRIQAWLGVDFRETTEWHSLGVFWSTDWNTPDDEVWAEVVGFDRLEFLRTTTYAPHAVFTDYSLYDLFESVLQDGGVQVTDYEIDSALDSVTIPYAWFDEVTHRYALQKLAEAGLAMVYCDRDGKIVVKQYTEPATTAFDFDEDNIFTKEHPLAWSEMANSIEVTATPLAASAQTEIYADLEEFAIGADEQVTKFYIFTHAPCTDVQQPTFTQSGADIHIETYTVYAWAVSVTFHNSGGTSQNVTGVSVEGKKLENAGKVRATAEDAASISSNGKVAVSIDNDFIQSTARAQDIADAILASYKDPRRDVTLKARGHIALNLGDKVSAPDFQDSVFDDFIIVRQELEWNGRLQETVTARRAIGT